MITISKTALDAIRESVKDRGESPCVRVYIAGYG